MAKKSLVLSEFLLLIFVIAISGEMATATKPPPKICERQSKMYSGNCYSNLCDKKCIEWERALHGACHERENKKNCFCYYDCAKSPHKDVTPAPPGSLPPPAGGGSSTPPAGVGTSPPPPATGGSPPPPVGAGSPPPGGPPPPLGGGSSSPPKADMPCM